MKKHCVTRIEGDDCDWWNVVHAAIVEVSFFFYYLFSYLLTD